MPEEAQEKLSFKSEDERQVALSKVESDPPSTLTSEEEVNNWIKEQEEEQTRVLEAEIVPEAEEAEPEPKAEAEAEPEPKVEEDLQEPKAQEEKQEESQIQPVKSEEELPPKEEDVIQFSYKHDDLPDSLKVYKDPEDIIRQAGHARKYANKIEKEMKGWKAEKEKIVAELAEYKKLKEQDVSKAPEVLQPEVQTDDLAEQLKNIDAMEDSDFVDAKVVKNVFGLAKKEIANTKKEIEALKAEFGGKLTSIEKTNTENAQKDEKARQQEAVVRGINELQDKYDELKTDKAVSSIMGQTDCVERDVMNFADQLLFSKFGNSTPNWQQRNAVINAYLGEKPEIVAYCKQNAITPESVGTTSDNMKKYATIMNIDANMRGEEIDKVTGERRQKVSPYNGNPVNFGSYIASYKDLKDTAGITQEEQKKKIAEAEIQGQQSLSEAMDVRADAPKTLSDKGTLAPQAVKDMTKENAWKLIDVGNEDEMERQALNGNRSLFHEYNKALKIVGFPEEKPSEHWPPEKK